MWGLWFFFMYVILFLLFTLWFFNGGGFLMLSAGAPAYFMNLDDAGKYHCVSVGIVLLAFGCFGLVMMVVVSEMGAGPNFFQISSSLMLVGGALVVAFVFYNQDYVMKISEDIEWVIQNSSAQDLHEVGTGVFFMMIFGWWTLVMAVACGFGFLYNFKTWCEEYPEQFAWWWIFMYFYSIFAIIMLLIWGFPFAV